MKIKQHGTIPEWKLDVTCKNCNAIITLEGAEDMYAKSHPTGKWMGYMLTMVQTHSIVLAQSVERKSK